MRLQKYLALAGIASRRKAEELIVAGRVSVDGHVVRELGTSVEGNARVTVDAKRARAVSKFTYLIMNKPASVMTTMRDPQGRRTIVDLIPKGTPRVVPVGRLDYDTSGVLLLTNDGELAFKLTHPRFGVEKTYRARVRGQLTQRAMQALQAGVELEEFRAGGAKLRVIAARGDHTIVDVTIHEGKYRQVRRMFEALGHPVLDLQRMRLGPLALGALAAGAVRSLTGREIAALRAATAKTPRQWKTSLSGVRPAPKERSST
ncbi:MAG: pseudouridine synthase [Candidatus Meridianibacter frigidus]|nr:MAG: pseudouridine synthase [Candidatus Eremiobacteraeota bacterium]